MQEVWVAKNAVLLYSKDLIPWDQFGEDIRLFFVVYKRLIPLYGDKSMSDLDGHVARSSVQSVDELTAFEAWEALHNSKMDRMWNESRVWSSGLVQQFLPMLGIFETSHCPVAHDRVYGLVRVCLDGDAFHVDYGESEESLCWRACRSLPLGGGPGGSP